MDENNKYLSNILESSKRGNIKSYYQLIVMHVDNVFALAFRLSGNYHVANEICFHTFQFAWKNIQQVRMNSSFISWLHGVAIFFVLEKYRNSKHELHSHNEGLAIRLSPVDVALNTLSAEERIILTLVDIKKYALNEVSDILPEFSKDELKAQLFSARYKISENLKR